MTDFYCDYDFCFSLLLEVVIVGWGLSEIPNECTKCSMSAVGNIKNIAKCMDDKINWMKRHEKKRETARQARIEKCKSSLVGKLEQLNNLT